jgi:hypothetical protein
MEGRIVETMLGVRMPRRPVYPAQGRSLLKRIGAMFTDVHTWTTLCYMWLMLPLGIAYFSVMATLLGLAAASMVFPLATWLRPDWLESLFVGHRVVVDWGLGVHVPGWGEVVTMFVFGVLLLFATLHLARGLGRLHGWFAKHMLVPRQMRERA